MHSKELTRQQIIDSEFTIECPICNDILIGNEPRSLIVCNKCRKEIIDLPDGWTCIECGDEYLEDTEGQLVADYTEGTLCRKCNQQRATEIHRNSGQSSENRLCCTDNFQGNDRGAL